MNIEKTIDSLKKNGYEVSYFETAAEAVSYLKDTVKGKTIGFGGSQTLTDMDLRHVLAENNTVFVPDFPKEGENFFTTVSPARFGVTGRCTSSSARTRLRRIWRRQSTARGTSRGR